MKRAVRELAMVAAVEGFLWVLYLLLGTAGEAVSGAIGYDTPTGAIGGGIPHAAKMVVSILSGAVLIIGMPRIVLRLVNSSGEAVDIRPADVSGDTEHDTAAEYDTAAEHDTAAENDTGDPLPAAPTMGRRQQRKLWDAAVAELRSIDEELVAFETDLARVLFTHRNLADVTDEYTADFYRKWEIASEVEVKGLHSAGSVGDLVDAVDAVRVAWDVAVVHAEAESAAWLKTMQGNRRVMQSKELLSMALDPGTPPEAAELYMDKALDFLNRSNVTYPRELVARARQAALESRKVLELEPVRI